MAARKSKAKPVGTKSGPAMLRTPTLPRPLSEFLGVALLAVGALMLGGLVSYQTGSGTLMGPVGQLAATALYASFGMAAYLITLGVLGVGVKALLGQGMEITLGEGVGFSVATVAGCVLLHVVFPEYRVHGYTAGGLAGELAGEVSLGLFHHAGTYLVAITLLCVGLIASTPLSAVHLIAVGRWIGGGATSVGNYLWTGVVQLVKTQRDPGPVEASENETTEDDVDAIEADADDDDDIEDDESEDDVEATPRRVGVKKLRPKSPTPAAAMAAALESRRAAESKVDAKRKAAVEELEDEEEYEEEEEEEDDDEAEDEVDEETEASEGEDGDEPEIIVRTDDDRTNGKKPPPRPEELAKQKPVEAFKSGRAAPSRPAKQVGGIIRLTDGDYELPPLHLFEASETKVEAEFDRNFVLEQAQRLVTALGEFKIRGKVTKIHPGPVITRYEFKPEAGVKLSRIESLENDIAMALEAIRIRILAPIPGKATVGFEVPNKSRETVYVKEILAQENFGDKKKLPLALGKDITGTISTIDLAKAPHLLVAGATGSGKSVGVNAMICSLLYACSPEDVRMIMIDPKMLELSIYEGIPHLLLPVVTDPEKAALALRWAVNEMERRYALLSEAQVRDIAGYNRKLPDLEKAWEHERHLAHLAAREAAGVAANEGEDMADGTKLEGMTIDEDGYPVEVNVDEDLPDKPTRLPYVVVIIDEFADLMMVASKEVEQAVARIAAKARAAGIHLIVATQRPSVDVITGTIKNNFPSRIAFQVTSEADSRTILDGKGAKQLLGMGDMLHMDRGMLAQRVHGCFVSEDEILKVVEFVKRQAKPVYNMDIVRKRDDGTEGGDLDEGLDPLYDRAVEVVAEAQKVSTSMLQRRLGVGYNRAAKIVEAMEERGVIGPARGTTPREVYVTAA
jgi:S-DNA-T family DNA segregation ATPase FtsK/SpoIIIE